MNHADDAAAPRLPRRSAPRTALEQMIWQRRLTLEGFAEYAESFARDHGERGTLSVRHLGRLVSGRGDKGRPLGRVHPDTARLLERIFDTSIETLLSPPTIGPLECSHDDELRQMLRASARIDEFVLALLHDQLSAIRRLDRQLGGVVAHGEVEAKIEQVTRLLSHSLAPTTREGLAALLSELHSLAGWQALDMGNMTTAWQHYAAGTSVARHTSDLGFGAHTAAGQAFVLVDLGDAKSAVELLSHTRLRINKADRLIRAWMAAAHGEVLAADGQHANSLRAFDEASALLPQDTKASSGPFVVLDAVHLARWRGHALARVGDPEAIDVLNFALNQLGPTFTRAETGLRVDLATAYAAQREPEASREHATRAVELATEIGSARQRRRLATLGHR